MMNLKQLFKNAIRDCKDQDTKEGLQRLRDWCFPELDTSNLEIVIHCKDCEYYKKFHKKVSEDSLTREVTMRCKLDKQERRPIFYCASAKERKK